MECFISATEENLDSFNQENYPLKHNEIPDKLFVFLNLITAETQLTRLHGAPRRSKRPFTHSHGERYCVWCIKVACCIGRVPFPLYSSKWLKWKAMMLLQLHPSVTTLVISDHFPCESGPNLLLFFVVVFFSSHRIMCLVFRCSRFNVASLTLKKKNIKIPSNKHRLTIHFIASHLCLHEMLDVEAPAVI